VGDNMCMISDFTPHICPLEVTSNV